METKIPKHYDNSKGTLYKVANTRSWVRCNNRIVNFKNIFMTEKEEQTHKLAMEIVKLLIDSGLSVNDQLKVINNVREKLLFCKKTGQEMKQLTLF